MKGKEKTRREIRSERVKEKEEINVLKERICEEKNKEEKEKGKITEVRFFFFLSGWGRKKEISDIKEKKRKISKTCQLKICP